MVTPSQKTYAGKIEWEELENVGDPIIHIFRAKIPGGWLVTSKESTASRGAAIGLTFVPDPNHTWDGNSIE